MRRLLLSATIMLAFAVAACTSSSVHTGIEGSAMRLSLDVVQSDFLTDSTETDSTDSRPQTRATETAFQKDDVMGLFVHTTTAVAISGNHSVNVKYIAKEANSWQAAGGLGGELVKGTAYKVTAYYPYKENAANALAIEHAVAADQSSAFNATKAGALELSDFMTATPTAITGNFATTPAAELTFSHKLAKLVVSLGVPHSIEGVDVNKVQSVTILNLKTKCTINIATGAITSLGEVMDITPRLVEGTGEALTVSKWEAIVVPQTVAAGTLMVRIVCLLKDATTKDLTYTVPATAPLTIVQSKKLTLALSSAADLAITKGLELIDGIAKNALELGVKATIGVNWTLISPEAWITLSTNNTTYATSISGTGTGLEQVVYVNVGANPSMNLPRNTVLTLSDAGGATTTHEVVQNYFSLQAVDATITGGTQAAAVEAFASNQIWNATSATAWLKLSATAAGAGAYKYGPHTGALAANALYYQAEANNTNADRTATVSYASNTPGSAPSTTTITQGKPVLGVSAASQNIAPHVTSATFNVTATANQKGVTYTPAMGTNATSVTPNTIQTINTAAAYSQPVTVGFTQNTTATARTIVATVKYGTSLTETHTITQAGIVLTGANPSTITQPNGSTVALTFTGSTSIAWSISAKPAWITASPASGTTTGAAQTVTLTATENATGANRTETLTIKMGSVTKDFAITQTASTISISAPAASMIAAASSSPAFTVTVGNGTPWTVSNSSGGWLTNTTASGTGNGAAQSVTLSAAANNTNVAREATVTVTAGGKTVTCKVTQAAPAAANFTTNFANYSGSAAMWASGDKTVTPATGLQWKLTGDAGVTVSPTATPQTGAVTNASASVGANNTAAARTLNYYIWYGALDILKIPFTITQAAPVVAVSAATQSVAPHITSATFNVTAAASHKGVIFTPVAGANATNVAPATAQTIGVETAYTLPVTVNFAANTTAAARAIVATVKYGTTLTATHTINQAGIVLTGANPAVIGQPNGSTAVLTFTGSASIAWTMSAKPAWITASSSGGAATGAAQNVTLTAVENTTGANRTGTLTIAMGSVTKDFTITQNASAISISTPAASMTAAAASSQAFTVTVGSGTPWTVSNNSGGWLTNTTASGTGSGAAQSVTLSAAANNTNVAREATVTVTAGGKTVTCKVTQAAPAAANFTTNFANYSGSAAMWSSSGRTVTPASGLQWKLTGDAGVTVSPTATPQTGAVTNASASVGANNTDAARTLNYYLWYGNLATLKTAYTITQAAPVINISAATQSVAPHITSATFNVTAAASHKGVIFTPVAGANATSVAPATAQTIGVETAYTLPVTVNFAQNTTATARAIVATVKYGASLVKTHTISQAGIAAIIGSDPAAIAQPNGSTTVLSFTGTASIPWTISAKPAWITATSPASGTATGSAQNVTLTASENTTGAVRTGTITVAMGSVTKDFALTQNTSSISISTPAASMTAAAASSQAFTVTVGSGTPWTVSNNSGGWLANTTASGTGNGAAQGVTLTAQANNANTEREATVTVTAGGKSVTCKVTQAVPFVGVNTATQNVAPHATSATFHVTTLSNQNGVIYTPVAGSNATSVAPATAQTINTASAYSQPVTVNFAANTTATARAIVATVKYGTSFTATHTINQAGIVIAGSNPAAIAQPNGSTATLTFTGSASIAWTMSTKPAWITANSSSGTATGAAQTVTLTATENTTGAARSGTLTIKMGSVTKDFTVTQNASSITISSAAASMIATANSAQVFTVTVGSGTSWTVTNSSGGWLTNTTASGTGNGAAQGVTLAVAVNNANTAREATVTVTAGGKSVICKVTQAAPTIGNFTTTFASYSGTAALWASGNKSVTPGSGLQWKLTGDAGVTFSPTATPQTGAVTTATASVGANNTAAARTLSYYIWYGALDNLKTAYTITQAAPVVGVSAASQSVAPHITSATFNVTTSSNQNGVIYTPVAGSNATSVAPNTVQTVNVTGNYSKAVTVSFAANTGAARAIVATVKYGTTLTVNHTITQNGIVITGSNPSAIGQINGSTATLTFTGSASIAWTMSAKPAWITANSSSGTATGAAQNVTLTATENTTGAVRTGTLTIKMGSVTKDFTVTQNTSSISISSAAASMIAATTSAQLFTVTVSNGTPWTVSNSSGGWLTNTTASGTGNGAAQGVTLSAAANNTAAAREATVTVTAGGKTVTCKVTQAVPVVNISAATQNVAAHITSATFNVTAAANHKGVTVTPVAGTNATSVAPATAQTIGVETAYTLPVTVNFAQNTTATARSIVATVKYGTSLVKTHTISQAGIAAITGSNPAAIAQPNGSTTVLSFTGTASIPWSVSAKPAWITPNPASGTTTAAAQNVTLTTSENTTGAARSGTLTIKMGSLTKDFTVTQNASTISISTANASMTAAAASSQAFTVTVGSGTPWTVSNSSGGWLTNTTASGTGNGAAQGVTLSAQVNNTAAAREATVTVTAGGKTVTCKVTQAAPVVGISATSQSVAPHATSATFNVTTTSNQSGVTYTPAVGANATSVTPNTAQAVNVTGNYSKAVTVGFAANTGAARNILATVKYGTSLTHTHTITQAAPALTISASSANVAAQATSATAFTVTSNVPFTPTYSSGASSGLGTGVNQPASGKSVTFSFPAQGSAPAAARNHTMTFTPNPNYTSSSQTRTFTATQAAVAPTFTISSSSPGVTIPKGGATYYISIISNTAWRISASSNIEVETTSSYGSKSSFPLMVPASTSPSTRNVTVTFTTTANAGQAAVTRTWSGTQEAGTLQPGDLGYISKNSDGTGLPAGMMCVGMFGGWNGSAYTKDLYIDKRGTNTSGVNQGTVDDGKFKWDYYDYTAPQGVNPTYNGLGNTAVLTASSAANYCRSKGMYLPAVRQLKDGMLAALEAGKLTSEYTFVHDGNYWSSTQHSIYGTWYVYFVINGHESNDSSSQKKNMNEVRCVQEDSKLDYFPDPIPGSYNVHVAKVDNAQSNWQTAADNCAAWGGRLPTISELKTIYNNKANYGTFVNGSYWNSYYAGSGYYQVLNFETGSESASSSSNDLYVRCVKEV